MSDIQAIVVPQNPEWRQRANAPQRVPSQMTAGLALMLVGIAVLLARVGLVHLDMVILRLWPVLLIAAGIARLLTPEMHGRRRGGALVLIGVWLLLHTMNIWAVGDSWPIFLIGWGLKMVWEAVTVGAAASRQVE